MKQSIEIAPYSKNWPEQYETLERKIWPTVASWSLRIEHVGSTSVPGLWAKPVIDLDIVVANEDDRDRVINALASIGYEHRGDLGIIGREAFHHPPCDIRHHLYLCIDGCTALRNHLTLRDHLRSHPSDCQAYSQLKQTLAKQFPNDIDRYVDGKTEFILAILHKHDIASEQLAEIERQNKLS